MSTLLEQASLVLIPSGYKEDTVYSVIPSNGSGDMSFTRASDGTRINSDGLVEVCPWNLFTYSEQFQNANWTGGGNGKPTMTDNFAEAPNGTFTASKMVAASDGYQIRQNNAIENTQMNLSVYLRTNTGTKTIQIFLNNGSTAFTNATVTTTWQRFEINGTVTTLVGSGRNGLATLEALTSSEYILVWGAQVNVGSTAKPYFPTTDRLNVPRLTYQNGGGGCPSLLLEPQRTNLVTYSEDFTIWTKGQFLATLPTVTADYGISPSGVQNADRVQMTRPSGSSYVEITKQSFITIGTVITFSVFIKSLIGATDMTIGALGSTNAINLTNDWVRYTYTMTTTNNPTTFSIGIIGSQADSLTADFLVWGAQVEAGAYQSSYIPTVASSATRIADACSKTGISSLIGQTEGTLFVDAYITGKSTTTGSTLLATEKVSSGAIIRIRYTNADVLSFDVYSGVSFQCIINAGAYNVGDRVKVAGAYKNNDFIMYVNGIQKGIDASGSVPTTDKININDSIYGDTNGSQINQAILFPTRLTNAQLATLTTI